ncbi:hypothetical protein [Rhodobacter maris]|uniref:Uncharacterized protein n=1 Tax=Rhodobacter maris TaxID=446682 RepID=A0A285S443_9RHOB|nr:hypothetical protein [Rhodobacter maris]SOC01790.1 hypothetical protein SAMN05877831_1033 [Rhodobacter maris]
MEPKELQRMCGRVSQLLAERLGARGHSLSERIASRHRSLPRKVRRAARQIAAAEAMIGAPRLARQLDPVALRTAYHICVSYLEPLGAPMRFGRRLLDIAATVAFGLIVMAGVGFAFMR